MMLIKLEIIKPLKPINSGRIIRRIFLIIAPARVPYIAIFDLSIACKYEVNGP